MMESHHIKVNDYNLEVYNYIDNNLFKSKKVQYQTLN